MLMERFYLDSNVIISLSKEEINGNLRPLFLEAANFFKYAKESKATIIVSDLFFSEAEQKLYQKRDAILEHLQQITWNVETAELLMEDFQQIRKIERLGIHRQDAKHVAIALRVKCDAIVTFNKKDFGKASHIIRAVEPNELR